MKGYKGVLLLVLGSFFTSNFFLRGADPVQPIAEGKGLDLRVINARIRGAERMTAEMRKELEREYRELLMAFVVQRVRSLLSLASRPLSRLLGKDAIAVDLCLSVPALADFIVAPVVLLPHLNDPAYQEHIANLRQIATCITGYGPNERHRVIDKTTRKPVCSQQSCTAPRECLARLLEEFFAVFEPFYNLLFKGIEIYGLKVDGLVSASANFVDPAMRPIVQTTDSLFVHGLMVGKSLTHVMASPDELEAWTLSELPAMKTSELPGSLEARLEALAKVAALMRRGFAPFPAIVKFFPDMGADIAIHTHDLTKDFSDSVARDSRALADAWACLAKSDCVGAECNDRKCAILHGLRMTFGLYQPFIKHGIGTMKDPMTLSRGLIVTLFDLFERFVAGALDEKLVRGTLGPWAVHVMEQFSKESKRAREHLYHAVDALAMAGEAAGKIFDEVEAQWVGLEKIS